VNLLELLLKLLVLPMQIGNPYGIEFQRNLVNDHSQSSKVRFCEYFYLLGSALVEFLPGARMVLGRPASSSWADLQAKSGEFSRESACFLPAAPFEGLACQNNMMKVNAGSDFFVKR
jgi:hypothetical protein